MQNRSASKYASWREFPGWSSSTGWPQTPAVLRELIEREGASSVLEVGAGRTPTLGPEDVRELGLRYVVNDIEQEELSFLGADYDALCFDMAGPLPPEVTDQRFELIFSRMVNEHVADGARYYTNIFNLLEPGGLTVHMFATFFTVPALVNRFMPQQLSDRIYGFASRGIRRYEKFPALYRWCRGPTRGMYRRFESIGFEVEEFYGYFGHGYYSRVPLLDKLEQAKSDWLAEHPIGLLTSYATVKLRKPGGATNGAVTAAAGREARSSLA